MELWNSWYFEGAGYDWNRVKCSGEWTRRGAQCNYLWKLVFLLKGIEMVHYKNRAGKYWSLETFMLLQQLFLLWDDVILQCICIPKFSNATWIFFFFLTWEWKEYLCSIVLILYLLIWDIRNVYCSIVFHCFQQWKIRNKLNAFSRRRDTFCCVHTVEMVFKRMNWV